MKTCFNIRGGAKVRIRFVRAFYAAVQAEMFASHMSEEEKNILFGKVLGKYNITTGIVKVCGEHDRTFWSDWFDIREKVKDWMLDKLVDVIKVLEPWQVQIRATFELAVLFLTGAVISLIIGWIKNIACWLFPSLDKKRKMQMEVYEQNKRLS